MCGRKEDEGKLRTDLIPSEPIEALATILTHGAKKYDDNNWMKGLPFRRVYAAMLRHLLAYRRGEYQDQESGHPHLWHAFCNLAFLIYYNHPDHYTRYEEFNDFKQEWAQKLSQKDLECIDCRFFCYDRTITPCIRCVDFCEFKQVDKETTPDVDKKCGTCIYNNADTHEHCSGCTKDYLLWESQNE